MPTLTEYKWALGHSMWLQPITGKYKHLRKCWNKDCDSLARFNYSSRNGIESWGLAGYYLCEHHAMKTKIRIIKVDCEAE